MNVYLRIALLIVRLGTASVPALRIEAPPALASARSRLEAIDRRRLEDIIQVVGITNDNTPIRVVLAPDNSDLARGVPPWIAGYAVGEADLVVIFPSRSPRYPDDTLEDVLRHEIAHVLIWRTAGGGPVPRWFNEGLAMMAERQRRFGDQTQLLYQLVSGRRENLEQIDRLFLGGESEVNRAYVLAGTLVHDLLQRGDPTTCRDILAQMRGGLSFEAALNNITGLTPEELTAEFWQHQRIWTNWVPLITSTTTVWIAVTALAIVAIYRHRRRNREIEERWAMEEEDKRQDD
jgi:hypothetical protein